MALGYYGPGKRLGGVSPGVIAIYSSVNSFNPQMLILIGNKVSGHRTSSTLLHVTGVLGHTHHHLALSQVDETLLQSLKVTIPFPLKAHF